MEISYYTINDLRLPPKRALRKGWTMERFPALDEALDNTARTVEQPREDEDLAGLALTLALRSYASQLACARILDILQPQEERGKKGRK